MIEQSTRLLVYFENLLPFILLGIGLLITSAIEGFLIEKYRLRGYLLFITKVAKWIIPLTLVAIFRLDYSTTFGEGVVFLLIGTIAWIIFLSPIYLIWKFYRNIKNSKNRKT